MEQLRLDDLRTGDRIRITTANSTYEILIVASEARLGELCGGQIDSPQLVTLTGNPAHARHERAAIDVGHEFQFATTTPHYRRREAAIRVIATSARCVDRDHAAHVYACQDSRRLDLSPIAFDRGGHHPAVVDPSS